MLKIVEKLSSYCHKPQNVNSEPAQSYIYFSEFCWIGFLLKTSRRKWPKILHALNYNSVVFVPELPLFNGCHQLHDGFWWRWYATNGPVQKLKVTNQTGFLGINDKNETKTYNFWDWKVSQCKQILLFNFVMTLYIHALSKALSSRHHWCNLEYSFSDLNNSAFQTG